MDNNIVDEIVDSTTSVTSNNLKRLVSDKWSSCSTDKQIICSLITISALALSLVLIPDDLGKKNLK